MRGGRKFYDDFVLLVYDIGRYLWNFECIVDRVDAGVLDMSGNLLAYGSNRGYYRIGFRHPYVSMLAV